MAEAGVYVEVWSVGKRGIQVSISELDEQGAGGGYRLFGPKFDGTSTLLRRHRLDERDAKEIRRYLDGVEGEQKPAAETDHNDSGVTV